MTDFDFISDEDKASDEDETAEIHLNPDYEPEPGGKIPEIIPRKQDRRKVVTATSGSLTPEIIKEARTANGLDIEAFFKKYHLDTNISIDRLLLGPLDEDGNLK